MNRHTKTIEEFCLALNKASSSGPPAVILIGSVARNSETPRSDVDLLVIGECNEVECEPPPSFHLHLITREDFLRKLRSGDDLAAWSVRFGMPVQDSGVWNEITGSSDAHIWPDWRRKMLHATRRLMLVKGLLSTGDIESASEEALYAASHIARAVLLKSNVFPLARAELILQTREAGHGRLAALLETHLFGTPDKFVVERNLQYLKKLLIELDESEFRKYSREFSKMAPLRRSKGKLNR